MVIATAGHTMRDRDRLDIHPSRLEITRVQSAPDNAATEKAVTATHSAADGEMVGARGFRDPLARMTQLLVKPELSGLAGLSSRRWIGGAGAKSQPRQQAADRSV